MEPYRIGQQIGAAIGSFARQSFGIGSVLMVILALLAFGFCFYYVVTLVCRRFYCWLYKIDSQIKETAQAIDSVKKMNAKLEYMHSYLMRSNEMTSESRKSR